MTNVMHKFFSMYLFLFITLYICASRWSFSKNSKFAFHSPPASGALKSEYSETVAPSRDCKDPAGINVRLTNYEGHTIKQGGMP